MRPAHSSQRMHGVSLLEVIISMALLLVGILGLIRLQIIGITADQGARAAGQAQELARELYAALERLEPVDDALLTPTYPYSVDPPTDFGNPFISPTNWKAWDDSYLTSTTPSHTNYKVVGVTPDSVLERNPDDASKPLFERKWAVWQLETSNVQSGVKMVAVSVVYRERTLPKPRLVTLYLQASNRGASMVNVAASR